MASVVRDIHVSSNRLNGAYSYEAFREYVRSRVDYVRSAKACRSRSGRDTEDEVVSIYLDDAIASCIRLVDEVVDHVDVCDLNQWLRLADAIACAGRISTFSGHVFAGQTGLRSIYDVAMLIDIFGRLSDPECGLTDEDLADTDDMRRRAQEICYDLLDGRVGLWIEWVRHQAALVSLATCEDFAAEWDRNAQARFFLMATSVSEQLSLGFSDTMEDLSSAISLVSDIYDHIQWDSFIADIGDDGFVPTVLMAGCVHDRAYMAADDLVSISFARRSRTSAWCAVSCTSPMSCVGSTMCALGW